VPDGGFRRFLGLREAPRLTELAEDPTPPMPAPFAQPSRTSAAVPTSPASPVAKAAQKFPETQKGEGGSIGRKREPLDPRSFAAFKRQSGHSLASFIEQKF
jgi:hypothetical protein